MFGQTRFFHVGLDELFLFGQFPYRKETARKGVQNVVYDHIMWCYNYAGKHNMQLMLWQDIFVTKEESPENGSGGAPHFTAELRKKLPKDRLILIVLGPTAKPLAYDLTKLGYRALDLGHMAKAYEWLKTRDKIVAGQFFAA